MLRKVLHATVSALLLAGGLLGAWAVVAGRPAPSEQELPGPRPVPVRTVLLAPRDVPRDLSAIGTLKAAREALHRLHARVADEQRTDTGTIVLVEKLRATPKLYPRRPGEPKREPL